jgi:hypothetical protein
VFVGRGGGGPGVGGGGVEEFERFAKEVFMLGSEQEYKELCGN